MHRISKLAAVAAVFVLLLTSATPDQRSRVLMRVGSSAATIADYQMLFGEQIPPTDTTLSLLAIHLRKLEDARTTLGECVTEDTLMLGRLMEWAHAVHHITELRTTLRAQDDSAAQRNFFKSHPHLFRWKEPHFIGSVVLTSTPGKAQATADSLRALQKPAAVTSKDFRVISYNVARGLNPYVDFAAFAIPIDLPENDRWRDAAVIDGEILEQPRSPEHVSELLKTLIADSLYRMWTDSLSAVLPAEIDSNSLDFIKNNATH
ncbi:MAG: hypothetical protein K2H84_04430 [Paramuribaculum sp.]|nr:hypothetical protein [Paramuribaculum sp.]